ncbi:hypothetical protein BpHYR1_036393 [Brachionus plicatilis]|uniref:Uncharacterized protein n=1 Tax=Brachionus plicatilis TaxID=10195 RepID=A0A3M7SNI8_BRAPC|nr:hypothetical protein BpHYR1_036393 [Brachionus plicatilis]
MSVRNFIKKTRLVRNLRRSGIVQISQNRRSGVCICLEGTSGALSRVSSGRTGRRIPCRRGRSASA